MTNLTPDSNKPPVTPLRCLFGALISAAIATPLYLLTISIAQTFASKPIVSTNHIVQQLTIAVRTLVVGMSALGTGIFGLVTIGLLALAIQKLLKPLYS